MFEVKELASGWAGSGTNKARRDQSGWLGECDNWRSGFSSDSKEACMMAV